MKFYHGFSTAGRRRLRKVKPLNVFLNVCVCCFILFGCDVLQKNVDLECVKGVWGFIVVGLPWFSHFDCRVCVVCVVC